MAFADEVFAQKRPKYEEELPRILNSAPSEALALLKIYGAMDPLNPSIHLQMGLVYDKRFRQSDFLTMYSKAIGNAQLAQNSMQRASGLIDEKAVRKNEDQYLNFAVFDAKGKYNVPWDSVKNRMDETRMYAENFLSQMPGIYSAFTRSFTHYQEAQKSYTSIVGRYKSLKDLYLLYDASLEQELNLMSMHYDSSLYYFARYKAATQVYPLKGYDQKMNIKDIVIYRLDGFEVEINFLLPEIRIWNYTKWAEQVKSYTQQNITKLRSDLANSEIRLSERVAGVDQEFAGQKFEPLKTDKETMFNLKKYDLNSVVEPLFLYKEAKHDLLFNKLLSQRIDSGATIDVDRKLFLYSQMINRIRESDSILVSVKSRNTQESYKRHNQFLDKYYKGVNGVNSYVNNEQLVNRQDFVNYISSLNRILLERYALPSTEAPVINKKVTYAKAVSPHPSDSVATLGPVTTHRVQNFDGSIYLGGTQFNAKEKKLEAFVIKLAPDGKLQWQNNFLMQIDSAGFDAHTRLAAMQNTQEGLVMVLSGRHAETDKMANHLLLIDESAAILTTKRLLFEEFPRSIFFHDRTNTYVVAFKGNTPELDMAADSELLVATHNILGDLVWQYRFTYAGSFEKMVSVEDGLVLACNFSSYRSADGRIVRAGSSAAETAPLIIKVDFEGKPILHKPILSSAPYFGNTLVRISDYCINLIGIKGEYRQATLTQDNLADSFHIIFDSNLEIISSNAE